MKCFRSYDLSHMCWGGGLQATRPGTACARSANAWRSRPPARPPSATAGSHLSAHRYRRTVQVPRLPLPRLFGRDRRRPQIRASDGRHDVHPQPEGSKANGSSLLSAAPACLPESSSHQADSPQTSGAESAGPSDTKESPKQPEVASSAPEDSGLWMAGALQDLGRMAQNAASRDSKAGNTNGESEDEDDDYEVRPFTRKPSPTWRARQAALELRDSPWIGIWILVGLAGVLLAYSEAQEEAQKTGVSPVLLAASILGITATKTKVVSTGATAAMGAWGSAWRVSGASGLISFYLRAVFAGKRIRVVEYPGPLKDPRERTRHPMRMRTMKASSASALRLRERIGRRAGLYAKDIRLYQWVTPGLFERLEDDGDLIGVPDLGFIVWARTGVRVPSQGPIVPPLEAPAAKGGSPGGEKAETVALLQELANLRLPPADERKLVALALDKDPRLLSLHQAYGRSQDLQRFREYAQGLARLPLPPECDKDGKRIG